MNKDKISPENIFKNRALLTETDEMWREMTCPPQIDPAIEL